jgi:hypothetical protein
MLRLPPRFLIPANIKISMFATIHQGSILPVKIITITTYTMVLLLLPLIAVLRPNDANTWISTAAIMNTPITHTSTSMIHQWVQGVTTSTPTPNHLLLQKMDHYDAESSKTTTDFITIHLEFRRLVYTTAPSGLILLTLTNKACITNMPLGLFLVVHIIIRRVVCRTVHTIRMVPWVVVLVLALQQSNKLWNVSNR